MLKRAAMCRRGPKEPLASACAPLGLLAVLLWFALGLSASAAENFAALLDKMARAYGGREQLAKISTLRETGRVEAVIRMGNSGSLLRVFEPPLKLRVEVGEAAHEREVRALENGEAWRDGVKVAGVAYDAMLLQALRLDLPQELLSHSGALVERKPMEYRGKELRVLELPMDRGMSLTAGIDPATGRILFSRGVSANLPNGPISFETYYDDFREVDGRLFAFKEINMAGGFKTAETFLSKIEVLPANLDHPFDPEHPSLTAK